MGAASARRWCVIGDQLGLYRAMAGGGAADLGRAGRARPARPSATCASGCATRRPAATSSTTRRPTRYSLPAEQAVALADEDSPVSSLGGFDVDRVAVARRAEDRRGLPHRRGRRLARARPGLFGGTERFFRPGYNAQPGGRVDPGARRRRGEARARARASPTSAAATAPRRSSWRRRIPNSTFVGFDYHEPSIERAREAAAEAGVGDRVALRGRDAPRTTPARATTWSASSTACTTWATRSGAAAHVREALAPRRHLDAGRAVRRRPRRGQPQPGRPGLLRAPRRMICTPGVAGPGGGPGARRPGRRGAPARGAHARPASRASAAPPRRRSTWCSRPGPEPCMTTPSEGT